MTNMSRDALCVVCQAQPRRRANAAACDKPECRRAYDAARRRAHRSGGSLSIDEAVADGRQTDRPQPAVHSDRDALRRNRVDPVDPHTGEVFPTDPALLYRYETYRPTERVAPTSTPMKIKERRVDVVDGVEIPRTVYERADSGAGGSWVMSGTGQADVDLGEDSLHMGFPTDRRPAYSTRATDHTRLDALFAEADVRGGDGFDLAGHAIHATRPRVVQQHTKRGGFDPDGDGEVTVDSGVDAFDWLCDALSDDPVRARLRAELAEATRNAESHDPMSEHPALWVDADGPHVVNEPDDPSVETLDAVIASRHEVMLLTRLHAPMTAPSPGVGDTLRQLKIDAMGTVRARLGQISESDTLAPEILMGLPFVDHRLARKWQIMIEEQSQAS